MQERHAVDYAFVLLFALIVVFQVLGDPIVGLADSGDFGRMMQSVGLELPAGTATNYRSYHRYYEWDPAKRGKPFPSSELLFLVGAVALNTVISKSGLFDITSLGIVHASSYVLIAGFLAYALAKQRIKHRWLHYLCALFMFTDVSYVCYFNSMYAEAASLIFFGVCAVAVLLIFVDNEAGRRPVWALILLTLAAALFSVAKLQNLVIAPPLALLVYVLTRESTGASSASHRAHRKLGAWLAAGLLIVCAGCWAITCRFPMGVRNVNVYNTIFTEILPNSPDPAQDLKELGLGPEWLKQSGTNAWSPGVSEATYNDVYKRVGEGGVMRFYLRNPGRLARLVWRSARYAFVMRPGYLGNFETNDLRAIAASGFTPICRQGESMVSDSVNLLDLPGYYLSRSFALYSALKQRLFGHSAWPFAVFVLANILILALKLTVFDQNAKNRTVSLLHLALVLMAVLQLVSSVVADGHLDLVKHLFLLNLMCDTCVVLLFGYVLNLLDARRRRRGLGEAANIAGLGDEPAAIAGAGE